MNPLTRHRNTVGFAFLIIIIAFVVIALMVVLGPMATNQTTQLTQAQTNIDKGRAAACAMNRQAIHTQITAYIATHPGVAMDSPEIQKRVDDMARCPGDGVYKIGPNGQVYCTQHAPPPANMLANMVTLQQEQQNPGGTGTGAPPGGLPHPTLPPMGQHP